MTRVRLDPATLRSQVKHSTTEMENSVEPDQLASVHHLIEWKSKIHTA